MVQDRSAIGGGFDNQMNKVADEFRNLLSKHDWSEMSSEQHTQLTSKLYSIAQQETDPKLQKNTRQGADASNR